MNPKIVLNVSFVFFGVLFGFLLSRAGATSFDFYAQLFTFQNLQLLWVICAAVGTGMLGVWLLKRFQVRSVLDGKPLVFERKPIQKGFVLGALMFGAGWGMTGSCPGSVAAMLGEGKLVVLPTLFGIAAGTYLYVLRSTLGRPLSSVFKPGLRVSKA